LSPKPVIVRETVTEGLSQQKNAILRSGQIYRSVPLEKCFRKHFKVMFQILEWTKQTKNIKRKRPPAPLNLICCVCSTPALDHLYFEVRLDFLGSLTTLLSYQLTPAIPADHSSGKQLSARLQKVLKDAEQG
jgi:hypothetical protein